MTAAFHRGVPPEPAPVAARADACRSGTRAMRRDDIPAVARMFNKIFRKRDGEAKEELKRYLDAVFFGSPNYTPETGSVVYDDGAGGIASAILSVPMRFTAHGRPVTARLLCAFMSDGPRGPLGAARLARSMRARLQEMCFSDNASPVSAGHWLAGGGAILPVQSLGWRRAFLPLAAATLRPSGKVVPGGSLLAAPLRLIDRALLRLKPSLRPAPAAGCSTEQVSPNAFFDCAKTMTQRFPVRPLWTKAEFDWLVGIAALNERLGELHCRSVHDAEGRRIGVFLFQGKAKATASVLNMLCEEGRESEVADQMFACLAQEGYALATGMAQPFMMRAISRQSLLTFRHRGHFCLVTRHADIADTAARNEILIGGLASESWSRLLNDF